MSITVYKEFRIEYKKDPDTVYNICSKSGTIEEITENEALFLYESLGKLLEIKDNFEK